MTNDEPLEPNGNGDCTGLRLRRNNTWNDIPCSRRYPYICRKRTGKYIVSFVVERKNKHQIYRIMTCRDFKPI